MKKYDDYFIDIQLSPRTVYLYSVRRFLQKAIDKNIDLFAGNLLDLGCGEMPYRQYLLDKNKKITRYIGVDIDNSRYHQSVRPDLYWDGRKINMTDFSVDTVLATELFEHVENLDEILREIHRVLTTGGIVFFSVRFIWPLHETPNDQYRYTPYSLKNALEKAGFKGIEIIAHGGYNAALAQMLCIWIRNRRMETESRFRKNLFEFTEKYVLYPIILKLLKKDGDMNVTYIGEDTMPTGFYGYAKK